MKNGQKANSVALKRSGPLDRAMADPTAKIKSQYHLSRVSGGRGFIHIYDQPHSDRRYHFSSRLLGGAMERSEMGASDFI